MADEIGEFRGARKITSLPLYPLQYHKNEEQLRKDLIDRGKKFVALSGVQYKSYDGMAYYKKKKAAVKVNITGRIMIDSSIHRRINPNYPISIVRPKDHDSISDEENSDNEWGNGRSGCEGSDSDGGNGVGSNRLLEEKKVRRRRVTRAIKDRSGHVHYITMIKADDGRDNQTPETLGKVPEKDGSSKDEDSSGEILDEEDDKGEKTPPEFSDEEYLIASPVVLGFAFAEKMWLEFTVSSVKEIQWNETAYESLVLEPKTKDIVKVCLLLLSRSIFKAVLANNVPQALVESHKYHAAESIDDVIQGKGKGLVGKCLFFLSIVNSLTITGLTFFFFSCPPRPSWYWQDAHCRGHFGAAEVPSVHGLCRRAWHRFSVLGIRVAENS